ncbi:MAG: (2Fe-2S)-binding protein [Chloroflexi bacterium]|nr:(2Fe-2S)-binding protein [Chloroflexota bacterium]
MKHEIQVIINEQPYTLEVWSHETLLRMLRERLGLTGAKRACLTGECGACSVLLNNRVVNACLVLAAEVDGAEIMTVEGLSTGEDPHPLQKAFLDHHGTQCGFCAPGFLMASAALLKQVSRPDEATIRAALAGNLCRCTGYTDIISSVQAASRARR